LKKAVFFDRDGVLNKLIKRDGGYYSPRDPSEFTIIPDSMEVTSRLKSKGYINIIISNQPDVARGYLTKFDLDKMTKMLLNKLALDDVFYCKHDDNECECRKPLPGLIFSAQNKWNIDLTKSVMVGDTEKDLRAAQNAGVKFYLLENDHNSNIETQNRIENLESLYPILL
jgi:D-glycero-D-manno-heptose 1,7-bisphosphate phosphatase